MVERAALTPIRDIATELIVAFSARFRSPLTPQDVYPIGARGD